MKERLLACALRMVAEEGVGSLTLRAIAKQAGVSHGAPLRHFPSRAALLSAVAVEGYKRNVEEREKALAATGPTAAERLHAAARSYVDFAVANPGLYELMSRPDLLLPTDPELTFDVQNITKSKLVTYFQYPEANYSYYNQGTTFLIGLRGSF